MKRVLFLIALLLAGPAFAQVNWNEGPFAREKAKFGGGYQESVDGGMDIDETGNLWTDGNGVWGGSLSAGSWPDFDTETEFENVLFNVLTPTDNVESMATAGGSGTAPLSDGASGLTMTDVLTESELDSESELEAQLADVTNVFTNNDGALADDDVSDDNVESMTTAGGSGTAPVSDGVGGLTMTDVLLQSELPLGDGDVSDTISISASGSVDLAALLQGGAANDEVMTWNGSAWAPESLGTLGGGAPSAAEYLVTTLHGTLTGERRFQTGSSLSATDAGANGDYTVDTIQDIRTTASPTFDGATLAGDVDIDLDTDTGFSVARGSFEISVDAVGDELLFESSNNSNNKPELILKNTTANGRPGLTFENFQGVQKLFQDDGTGDLKIFADGGAGSYLIGDYVTGKITLSDDLDVGEDLYVTDDADIGGMLELGTGATSTTFPVDARYDRDGSSLMRLQNLNTGTSASARARVESDGNYIDITAHGGSQTGSTGFGQTLTDWSEVVAVNAAGMAVGTSNIADFILGTDSTAAITIDGATQNVHLGSNVLQGDEVTLAMGSGLGITNWDFNDILNIEVSSDNLEYYFQEGLEIPQAQNVPSVFGTGSAVLYIHPTDGDAYLTDGTSHIKIADF